MGAWIEITLTGILEGKHTVAPFMGAWIEIASGQGDFELDRGRTLYGCVD